MATMMSFLHFVNAGYPTKRNTIPLVMHTYETYITHNS